MIEKIKEGYNLFIRRNEDNELIGSLTLNGDSGITDFIECEEKALSFIEQFDNIYNKLSEDVALTILYDKKKDIFISEMKKKDLIGMYNDEIVWNELEEETDRDIFNSLNKLNNEQMEKRR